MSTWRALVWKEFQEHKWKAIALFAILVTVPAYTAVFERDSLTMVYVAAIMMYSAIAGIFLAMHTVASEKSSRTLPLLQALPFSMRKVAIVKLVAATIGVSLPILATASLLVAWVNLVDPSLQWLPPHMTSLPLVPSVFTVAGIGCLCATSIYLWTTLFGLRSFTEVQVGSIGVLALAVWTLVVAWFDDHPRLDAMVTVDFVGPPYLSLLAAVNDNEFPRSLRLISTLPIRFGVLTLVGYTVICRFGETRSTKITNSTRPATSWLGSPRTSPMMAIIWKQFREAAPYCITTTLVIVVLSVIIGSAFSHRERFSAAVADSLAGFAVAGAFVLAVLLGVGTFADDMRKPMRTFWQSQPIDPNLWFWAKFLMGAGAIIAGLLIPLVLAWLHNAIWLSTPGVSTVVLLIAIAYSLAVLMTCLIRQPIYAGVLAIPLTISFGLLMDPMEITQRFEISLTLAHEISFYAHVAGVICSVLLAWLAVRFDWGVEG